MDLDEAPLPPQVRERLPVSVERATRKVQSLQPSKEAGKLVRAAQAASTAPQRVRWLQRAASAWSKPIERVSACRKGCSHCCKIPVTISAVEAALIGRHTGLEPARPANAVTLQAFHDLEDALPAVQAIGARDDASPCPFLVDDACSIYHARPMACRLLLNLDDDDLLCQRVEGATVPVPYANSDQLKTLYLMAQVAAPLADIRDFFPLQVATTRR